jgi:hypothetical protein
METLLVLLLVAVLFTADQVRKTRIQLAQLLEGIQQQLQKDTRAG